MATESKLFTIPSIKRIVDGIILLVLLYSCLIKAFIKSPSSLVDFIYSLLLIYALQLNFFQNVSFGGNSQSALRAHLEIKDHVKSQIVRSFGSPLVVGTLKSVPYHLQKPFPSHLQKYILEQYIEVKGDLYCGLQFIFVTFTCCCFNETQEKQKKMKRTKVKRARTLNLLVWAKCGSTTI